MHTLLMIILEETERNRKKYQPPDFRFAIAAVLFAAVFALACLAVSGV